MRIRNVPPYIIVPGMIEAHKAGLKNITRDELEAHYLAGGHVEKVVHALVSASKANIELPFQMATAIDLAGRDVFEAVQMSVNPKVIDTPPVTAVAKDGIQLIAKARVTVRANIRQLVGGAGEDTILARVGEGIVSSIGSSENHKSVLENPDSISKLVLRKGLDAGTAFEILSIDIADIDIGKNIGAALQIDQANADKNIAQAKAEERRAMAVASEQEMKAKAQEDVDRGIDLILNKKDELISFDEPLSFIFSHSALREGWDNPNVFVLVTLKEGGSDIAKKQEVGRGLRLPVDTSGARCYDTSINELTVVANDYYDHFADSLQTDYNKSIGFDKNEVSADVIKLTMIKAGIPKEKVEEACDAFRRELMNTGAVKIDKSGKMVLTNDAEEFPSILFNDPVLIEHSKSIVDSFVQVMQEKGSKKIEISNGDETPFENKVQKYVTEGEFDKMYRKMLTILQKRSVYKYKLDTDAFIQAVTSEINRQLDKKKDFIKFEITNADVDFTDARKMQMTNAESQIEDSTSHTNTYEHRPLFELINIIMFNTMLPRLAIIRIINGLTESSRNKINNQDYLEETISIIKKTLTEFKSKHFEKAELISGIGALEKDIFEVDKIVNESEIRYLFTPNPSHRRAMNLKYKFDSDGELKFANSLDNDPNVLLYTKLKKGGFVLDTPAGNYSPDWAIVYQGDDNKLEMYFIAETKWDKDAGDLNDDEKIKIKCATRHFEAVNDSMAETVKYAWVNAYKDSSKDNSFPEIFIDENYTDSLAIERIANGG